MRKNILIRTLCGVLSALMILCAIALSGCSASRDVLLEIDGQTLSSNAFQLMLSRAKANLGRGGYKVDDNTFWDTIIDENGIDYEELIFRQTLTRAKQLVAAAAIFEDEGLTLSKETKQKIEDEITEFIDYDADGSKSKLNSELSRYGANVDTIRELYTLEAKFDELKTHLYGTDASKVAATVKQDYLEQNMVCFKQILFRNYYELYETDVNGDHVYYLTDSNNARVNNIAYDTTNGIPHMENGEIVVDANGDTVYYKDGRIAYNKEKGQRAPLYDDKGKVKVNEYTKEEKEAHLEQAQEILLAIKKQDYTAFESMMAECVVAADEAILVSDEFCFLYTTGGNDDDYLNDIADELAPLDDGTVKLISSEYGHAVLMKYPMEDDAYQNDEYTEWFGDFNRRVTEYLYEIKCATRFEEITLNEEVAAALPSIKELASDNYYY